MKKYILFLFILNQALAATENSTPIFSIKGNSYISINRNASHIETFSVTSTEDMVNITCDVGRYPNQSVSYSVVSGTCPSTLSKGNTFELKVLMQTNSNKSISAVKFSPVICGFSGFVCSRMVPEQLIDTSLDPFTITGLSASPMGISSTASLTFHVIPKNSYASSSWSFQKAGSGDVNFTVVNGSGSTCVSQMTEGQECTIVASVTSNATPSTMTLTPLIYNSIDGSSMKSPTVVTSNTSALGHLIAKDDIKIIDNLQIYSNSNGYFYICNSGSAAITNFNISISPSTTAITNSCTSTLGSFGGCCKVTYSHVHANSYILTASGNNADNSPFQFNIYSSDAGHIIFLDELSRIKEYMHLKNTSGYLYFENTGKGFITINSISYPSFATFTNSCTENQALTQYKKCKVSYKNAVKGEGQIRVNVSGGDFPSYELPMIKD